MKNQLVTKLTLVIYMTALGFILPGCGGTVSGNIYLDKNGNGTQDLGEEGAGYVELVISKNGEQIAKGFTDKTGTFSIKSKGSGRYCIKVDTTIFEKNLNLSSKALVLGAKAQSLDLQGQTPKTVSTAADTDQESSDDNDAPATSEKTPASTTSDVVGWSESGYCQEVKGKGLTLSIPITMDYQAALADLPPVPQKKYYAGQTFDIGLPLPNGCTLNSIYLPEALSLAKGLQLGIVFDSSANRIDFVEEVASRGQAIKAQQNAAVSISTGGFEMIKVKLMVGDMGMEEDYETTITPKATCNNVEIPLREIPITLSNKLNLTVSLQLVPAEAGGVSSTKPGDTVQIMAAIENNGPGTVVSGDLLITLKTSTSLDEVTPIAQFHVAARAEGDGGSKMDCNNLGTKVKCPITAFFPGSKRETTSISLPLPVKESIKANTKYLISAEFKPREPALADPEATFTTEPIEFVLEAPEDEEDPIE